MILTYRFFKLKVFGGHKGSHLAFHKLLFCKLSTETMLCMLEGHKYFQKAEMSCTDAL